MHARTIALASILVMTLSACASLGKTEVRVESGNQPTGFLSRPMSLTASSEATIQDMAQDICDHVKAGSTAKVSYVGKTEGSGPVDLVEWGRYRYDCEGPIQAAKPVPAARPAPVVAASVVTAPVAAAPTAAPVMASAPPSAPPASAVPSPAPDTIPVADERHQRQCLMQQGAHFVCIGNCMMRSQAAPATVPAECEQICPPRIAPGCN